MIVYSKTEKAKYGHNDHCTSMWRTWQTDTRISHWITVLLAVSWSMQREPCCTCPSAHALGMECRTTHVTVGRTTHVCLLEPHAVGRPAGRTRLHALSLGCGGDRWDDHACKRFLLGFHFFHLSRPTRSKGAHIILASPAGRSTAFVLCLA
jgi:hypothetical protein